MTRNAHMTLGEARARFFRENGLPSDGGYGSAWWSCRFGKLKLYFYNFDWRQRAVGRHDLHHVITGYECNLAGEIQMAAWEFAAGPFPHICARLFCLPLILAGTIFMPVRTFHAFVRGRRSKTLYDLDEDGALLGLPLCQARGNLLPPVKLDASIPDAGAYCWLVLKAFCMTLTPAIATLYFLL